MEAPAGIYTVEQAEGRGEGSRARLRTARTIVARRENGRDLEKMRILVDLTLSSDGILPNIDQWIICPGAEEEDECCGTMIQTDQIGIVECNECGAEFELWQHAIED